MVLVVCFQNNIIVKVFNCSLQTNLIFELSEEHSQFLKSGSTGLQLYWDGQKGCNFAQTIVTYAK